MVEPVMAKVTIREAKAHLSQLIRRAVAGEEIIVSKGKEPVVKLVPVPGAKKPRTPGGAKGIVEWISPDYDGPLKEFEEYMR